MHNNKTYILSVPVGLWLLVGTPTSDTHLHLTAPDLSPTRRTGINSLKRQKAFRGSKKKNQKHQVLDIYNLFHCPASFCVLHLALTVGGSSR